MSSHVRCCACEDANFKLGPSTTGCECKQYRKYMYLVTLHARPFVSRCRFVLALWYIKMTTYPSVVEREVVNCADCKLRSTLRYKLQVAHNTKSLSKSRYCSTLPCAARRFVLLRCRFVLSRMHGKLALFCFRSRAQSSMSTKPSKFNSVCKSAWVSKCR